jgi:hypothetical protein
MRKHEISVLIVLRNHRTSTVLGNHETGVVTGLVSHGTKVVTVLGSHRKCRFQKEICSTTRCHGSE